jgi:hypothetical protein
MYYQNLIIEATGCNSVNAAHIEDIMRNDIFHSTLDWQTKKQLTKAAREAAIILAELQKDGYYL